MQAIENIQKHMEVEFLKTLTTEQLNDIFRKQYKRIKELEQKIEEHNQECKSICESRDCDPRYRRPHRRCPDCSKDWMVE